MTDKVIEDIKMDPLNPSIGFMFASHNIASTRKVLEQLRQAGLVKTKDSHLVVDDPLRTRIVFAQLLGALDFCLYERLKRIRNG
jgi:hypothetical protein